jgi:hypothetical protein
MRNIRYGSLFLVVFLLLLLLNACAYTQHSLSPNNTQKDRPLPSDAFCVMLASDGAYGSKIYLGSGRMVSNRIIYALRKKHPLTQLIENTDDDQAIQQCLSKGANYLISPQILHWEDRATQWSGMRDHVKIEIRLIKVNPKTFVRSAFFEARNNWFTFVNADPSELFDESFDKIIADISE